MTEYLKNIFNEICGLVFENQSESTVVIGMLVILMQNYIAKFSLVMAIDTSNILYIIQ